jgi:hypothetical protein
MISVPQALACAHCRFSVGVTFISFTEGIVKFLRIIFLAGISLLFGNAVLAADDTVDKVYNLPGHGQLYLAMPTGWNDELRKHPGDFPPTIFISGFEGSPFVVFVTPRWPDSRAASDFGTPKSIHDIVAKAAQAAALQSVEGKLSIVTMGGGRGPGYYFDATDRAPKPGEFKYMTQGAVAVGGVVCTFTILTNDKKSVVKNKALTMVSRAGWRPKH